MKNFATICCLFGWILTAGCDLGVQSTHVIKLPLVTSTASGQYTLTCEFLPDPVPRNEHFSLKVDVSATGGDALPEGLTLQVDAEMPAHGHGINTAPEIKTLTPGSFQVDGLLFHMGGNWELHLDVMVDGIPDRATIPVKL